MRVVLELSEKECNQFLELLWLMPGLTEDEALYEKITGQIKQAVKEDKSASYPFLYCHE